MNIYRKNDLRIDCLWALINFLAIYDDEFLKTNQSYNVILQKLIEILSCFYEVFYLADSGKEINCKHEEFCDLISSIIWCISNYISGSEERTRQLKKQDFIKICEIIDNFVDNNKVFEQGMNF